MDITIANGDRVLIEAEVVSAADRSNVVLRAGGVYFRLPAAALMLPAETQAALPIAPPEPTEPETPAARPRRWRQA